MIRRASIIVATFVLVLAGAPTALAVGPGVITGTVSPAAVAPEVEVCVVEVQPSELCTAPEPGGNYRLTGVPVGPQRVEFVPSHRSGYLVQYFDRKRRLEEATTIVIQPPPGSEVKGINAELELGSSIEGSVKAASGGSPLADVEVCVRGLGTPESFGCATTDLSGGYAVAGLPKGTYEVGFWGRGRSARYAPGSAVVSVPAATALSGIDAALAVGALVEGSVTAASTGAALSGVPVCLFAVDAVTPGQCVFTESAGAYSLPGLPAGDYQVGFSLSGGELGGDSAFGGAAYLPQYYDGATTRSEARILSLGLGQVETGVDAVLLPPSAAVTTPPLVRSAGPAPLPAPVLEEPAKAKAKKKCRRAGGKRISRARSTCGKKRRHKQKRRHGRHHRTRHVP